MQVKVERMITLTYIKIEKIICANDTIIFFHIVCTKASKTETLDTRQSIYFTIRLGGNLFLSI